jgi:hypothetical protein
MNVVELAAHVRPASDLGRQGRLPGGTDMNQEALRGAIIQYWSDKAMTLGLPRAKHCELIKGMQGQRLYWLILLARHELAHKLWSKISSSAKSPGFDF